MLFKTSSGWLSQDELQLQKQHASQQNNEAFRSISTTQKANGIDNVAFEHT